MPARIITAAAEIQCPVCRRRNLDFGRARGTITNAAGWRFFCPGCKATAELAQHEIDRCDQDGGFAELLRARLIASMGRGDRIAAERGANDEGPDLKLRDDQRPSPLGRVKRRPPKDAPTRPAVVRPTEVPKDPPALRLQRRPLRERAKRLRAVRQRLTEALERPASSPEQPAEQPAEQTEKDSS